MKDTLRLLEILEVLEPGPLLHLSTGECQGDSQSRQGTHRHRRRRHRRGLSTLLLNFGNQRER